MTRQCRFFVPLLGLALLSPRPAMAETIETASVSLNQATTVSLRRGPGPGHLLTYPGLYLPESVLHPVLPEPEPDLPVVEPEAAPADLFGRIREGFGLQAVDSRAVQVQLDWYVRNPAYVERVFTRAQRFLPYIVEQVEARGMPTELALLPVVESAFDPFAYSHGRAAGLWQIIPGTGRRFGLKQNWWYDGRRDPVAATRAALDYLEYLHEKFDGDWLLAVAAYNSGEGNVIKAQRKNDKRNRDTDFWSLSLPRETEAYVPKLLAVRALVADPEALGLSLPTIADQPYFDVVEFDSQIDLALAAELAGIEIGELYALNAGFNRWATDPDGPHRLQLPAETASAFSEALAALPERERVKWVRYKVREGDALGNIARKHDTTVELIREVNGLKGSMIRAGSYLMIPTATRKLDSYSHSADVRLSRTQGTARGSEKIEHVVKPGESFWSIGQQYGVSTRSLAKWNGMAPGDTLSVGKKLVIWNPSKGKSTVASTPGQVRRVTYTVRQGDSLARISSRFKVSVNQLKKWNAGTLGNSRYLQPGQKLVMYVDVTAQSSGV